MLLRRLSNHCIVTRTQVGHAHHPCIRQSTRQLTQFTRHRYNPKLLCQLSNHSFNDLNYFQTQQCSTITESNPKTNTNTITNESEILTKIESIQTTVEKIQKQSKTSHWRKLFFLLYFSPLIIVYGFIAYNWRENKKKLKKCRSQYKVLNIRTSTIRESASDLSSIMSSSETTPVTFQTLISSLRYAYNDNKVLGISLILDEGSTIGLAQTQELMEELQRLKQINPNKNINIENSENSENSGNSTNFENSKFILAYGRRISMRDFLLSTMADEFYLQPSGLLNIFGLSFPNIFLKNMFEKIGIEPFILKRENYKTFGNIFTETGFTKEHRESMENLGNDLHNQYINILKKHLDLENINEAQYIIDNAPYVAQESYDNGLIDGAIQWKDYQIRLAKKAYNKEDNNINNDDNNNNNGPNMDDEILYVTPKEYLRIIDAKPKIAQTMQLLNYDRTVNKLKKNKKNKNINQDLKTENENENENEKELTKTVALINVFGEIRSGESDGMETGSETIDKLLKEASESEDVIGIILRIDSPGGDAIASETIWNSVMTARDSTNKPIVVSMGDVCASGGYYIASAADKIVAMPGTITGSIGVIMAAFTIGKLMEKLGITYDTIKFAENADINVPFDKPSEKVYKKLEIMIDSMYDIFLSRVATGRDLDRKSVREIAQGKIWTGKQAEYIGLVDKLGGLYDAKKLVEELANLPKNQTTELIKYAGRSERMMDIFDLWSDIGMTMNMNLESSNFIKIIGISIISISKTMKSFYKMILFYNKMQRKIQENNQIPKAYYLFDPFVC